MAITQKNRSISIKTPLGADVLVLRRFTGTEQMSHLFQFETELLSEKHGLNFDDIIGQNVTVQMAVKGGQQRCFNGHVSRFMQTGSEGRLCRYQATIVPWLWFLTRTADCRIFQAKTVPDIIEEVFKGHKFDAYELGLSNSYKKWEYCVQYRETDFNFVSRLMEQEGIYYFFKHDQDKHTLVLADSPSAHNDFPGYGDILFRPPDETRPYADEINEWIIHKELQTGTYAHTDFNFEKPKTSLAGKSNVPRPYAQSQFEIFDYPGEYEETAEGGDYAKLRIQELQAGYEILQGQANARGIVSGYTFQLKEHPRDDQNRKYLVLSARHSIEEDVFESGESSKGAHYNCGFHVVVAKEPYRAPRITPKPLIQGPQTAIVVGPKGEEIYPDKHGRVKLMFHWDRYSKADETSSCWVRVSQAWAGKNWGAMYIPRIGQEVIVEFLEADPDRPIITGRVYNGDAMPPYGLPANKTMSTLKSLSSKGGDGFNEIRYEDKKGSEQIFIHGEKNLDIRIKNDAFETIGNDQHIDVKKDQFEHVENNRNETVDADHMEKIGKDRHLDVVGKEAKSVGGSLSLTVSGDVIEVFKGNHSEQVTSDYYLKADNIVIEGMTNVTIKVGQSFIAIEAGGISIGTSGTIDMKDSGGLSIQSQAQAQVKAPQVAISGDATVTIKGGMVAIN